MVITVSGFGWSGSGAIYDLLREYSDVQMASGNRTGFEFCLLYDVDGIRDLEYHIVECPRRISPYAAIDRFLQLIGYYIKFHRAEHFFKNQFAELANLYIESLVDFQFKGTVGSTRHQRSALVISYNNIIRKIFCNRYTVRLFGYKYKKLQIKKVSDVRVSYRPDNFLSETRNYIHNLFAILQGGCCLPLVFDQLLPPDNPEPFMRYLEDAKCIVVRRDPRDTYLLAKCTYESTIPVPVDTVDDFIVFYQKVIENTYIDDNPDVLNIQFEDMIYKYNETIKKIESFLGISKHTRPLSHFKPSVSVNNTQLYRRYKGFENDIQKIEEQLPESLYPFENYPSVVPTSSKVF